MRAKRVGILATALLALLVFATARADIVVLKNGNCLEGSVIRAGEFIRVEVSASVVIIVRENEVEEVRKGSWKDEYARRRAEVDAGGAGDAEALYQLAAWCCNKGLEPEYARELQAVLALDPEHAGVRERLKNMKEEARRPKETSAGGLRSFLGDHISAASDGPAGTAEKVSRAGEKAIGDFAELLGLDEDDRRLKAFRTSVRHYDSDLAFNEAARRAGASGNSGFHSVSVNQDGSVEQSCHVRGPSWSPETYRSVRHEVGHALLWQVKRIGSYQAAWLHETIATQMENEGPDGLASMRLTFLAFDAEEADLSIEGLLASRFQDGELRDRLRAYGRVWSFGHFIFQGGDEDRRKTFMAFLKDCRGWQANINAAFDRHFPEREKLETAWRAHVNGLIDKHLDKEKWARHIPASKRSDKPRRRSTEETAAAAPTPPQRPRRQGGDENGGNGGGGFTWRPAGSGGLGGGWGLRPATATEPDEDQ